MSSFSYLFVIEYELLSGTKMRFIKLPFLPPTSLNKYPLASLVNQMPGIWLNFSLLYICSPEQHRNSQGADHLRYILGYK